MSMVAPSDMLRTHATFCRKGHMATMHGNTLSIVMVLLQMFNLIPTPK